MHLISVPCHRAFALYNTSICAFLEAKAMAFDPLLSGPSYLKATSVWLTIAQKKASHCWKAFYI